MLKCTKMKILRHIAALLIIVQSLSAQEVPPAALKAYRVELSDPDNLAAELLRVRRDLWPIKLDGELAEVGVGLGKSREEVSKMVETALDGLQKKAIQAAEKRENLTATKEESRAEAAQWGTISRIQEVLGKQSEAHAARMSRLAALTKCASAEDWLEGALEVALSLRKGSSSDKADEWMEQCKKIVEGDAAFRDSERSKVRIAFQEALVSNEQDGIAKAAAAVVKVFGPKDSFSMKAYEAFVLGASTSRGAPDVIVGWRKLLEMREAVFGAEHPATIRLVAKYGRYLQNYGDKKEGTLLQKRAVDGWLAAGALGSESRLSIAESLARQGRADGDNAYTDKLLRALIPVSEKLRGAEHRETLWLRSDLALVIGNVGNYAEAEQMDRELIEIRKRVFGPDDRDVATSMNNAAVQLSRQGKYRESLAMYEDSNTIRLKSGKEGDTEVLRTKSNIAGIFISLGRFDEAAPLVKAVLELRSQKLGSQSRDAVYSKWQNSFLLFSKGDIGAAETTAREYLEDTLKLHGAEHQNSRYARCYLAGILVEKGDLATALDTAREISKWYEQHPGEDRAGKVDADMLLGEALMVSGDLAKARPLLLAALRDQEALAGPTDLGTLRGKLLVARVHIKSGEAPAAEPVLRSIIDTASTKLDAEHPLIAEAGIELADVLEKDGKSAEAAEFKKRAREIATKKLHADSPLRKRCEK